MKTFLSVITTLWICSAVAAQEEKKSSADDKEEAKPPTEFTEQYDQRFLKRDPKIGEPIDAVDVFDEDGKPLNLESLRGKYTVLVFGCMT